MKKSNKKKIERTEARRKMLQRTPIQHITLQTGHCMRFCHDKKPHMFKSGCFSEDLLKALAPIVIAGGGVLLAPFDDYSVIITHHPEYGSYVFSFLYRGVVPAVTGILCLDAKHSKRLWSKMTTETLTFVLAEEPDHSQPWLAIDLHSVAFGWMNDWIENAEQYIALSIIANREVA